MKGGERCAGVMTFAVGAGRGVKKQKAEDASVEVRKGTAEPVPDAEPRAASAPEGETVDAPGTMPSPLCPVLCLSACLMQFHPCKWAGLLMALKNFFVALCGC